MTKNEFQKEQELERQKLLIVELPNLIQRILNLSRIPLPSSERLLEANIEQIKKITNAECESALAKFKI